MNTVGDEATLVTEAAAALQRATGMSVRVLIEKPETAEAPLIEIRVDGRLYLYVAQTRNVDRFSTPAQLREHWDREHEPLLVAPFITKQTAAHCRDLKLAFIDTAGNAYLEKPGLFVYAVGQQRQPRQRPPRFRAQTRAGMQVTFALLCRPELLRQNYRAVAAASNVALGTVALVMRDLEERKFLIARNKPRLLDPRRLLEEWVTHYPKLRERLHPRRFEATNPGTGADLRQHNAYWGGEVAADKLTGILKPSRFTIYARPPVAPLVAAARLRADPNGRVEVLDVFWNDRAGLAADDIVPPVLVYADLIASNDSRNIEAARIVYERHIEPALYADLTAG